jgi:hypothetical protein
MGIGMEGGVWSGGLRSGFGLLLTSGADSGFQATDYESEPF